MPHNTFLKFLDAHVDAVQYDKICHIEYYLKKMKAGINLKFLHCQGNWDDIVMLLKQEIENKQVSKLR